MSSQTVRIGAGEHALLGELAKATGRPMSVVLSDAIYELHRRRLLEATNDAYARLRQDEDQ